jgi:hypothetical protein
MSKGTTLNFKRRPGSFFVPFLALIGMNKHFHSERSFSKISAKWKGHKINEKHLEEFNNICRIDRKEDVSPIYPLTLIYPLIQRILCRKEAPLSMFRVLNNRIQLLQHQSLRIDDTFDIHCELTGYRIRPKGLEIYISSVLKTAETPVWQNIQTFYYRGKFGTPDEEYKPPMHDLIPDSEHIKTWFLPEGIGRRFSKISGDTNAIHYSKRWARMFGFERDFAQPLLVLGTSFQSLAHGGIKRALYMDVFLKGQLYYGRDIIIKGIVNKQNSRFDIYCGENPRPSMSGLLESVEEDKILEQGLTVT